MLDRGNLFGEIVLWLEGENICGGRVVYLHSRTNPDLPMMLGIIQEKDRRIIESPATACWVPPEDWLYFPCGYLEPGWGEVPF